MAARSARQRRSPQDTQQREEYRAAQLQQLHDELTEGIRQLRTGDDWRDWLQFATRFHQYSFRNVVAIYRQRPDATAVAGYRAWQALGRQVQKGERGIRILAPVLKKVQAAEPDNAQSPGPTDANAQDESAAAVQRRIVGFTVTHVWDVSQTTGEPLPQPPAANLLTGQAPPGLWDGLSRLVADRGYQLHRRTDLARGANGVTDPKARTVHVRDDVDDAQAVKTLAHELGHILLDHRIGPGDCKGRIEVEAESVAFLITGHHGLRSDDYSFGYIAGWATQVADKQPEEVVTETGQRVLTAASTIITALDKPAPAQAAALADLAARTELTSQRTAAITRRAEAALTHIQNREIPTPSGDRANLLQIHQAAMEVYDGGLTDTPAAQQYLHTRGLTQASGDPWHLGYATPSWTSLVDHLRDRGFNDDAIEASGLVVRTRDGRLVDRFRDRVTFPLRDDTGAVVGFIGRALSPDDRTPKYLNSPDTAIYNKGRILYGLTEQRSHLGHGGQPIIVEGPMDVIAVHAAGDRSLIPLSPCGTALTAHHATAIRTAISQQTPVIVAFDADSAGRQAAVRTYDLFHAHPAAAVTVTWPDGEDPASYLNSHGAGALINHLRTTQRPLVETVIDQHLDTWPHQLQHFTSRVLAVRSIAPLLTTPPVRDIAPAAAHLAARTELDHTIITELLMESIEKKSMTIQKLRDREPPSMPLGLASRHPAALAREGFTTPLDLSTATAAEPDDRPTSKPATEQLDASRSR